MMARLIYQTKMGKGELPPVEDGAENEREENADAAQELHEATEETLHGRKQSLIRKRGS